MLQVLAALSYSRNPDGVAFTNPSKWIHNHLFDDVSIWDVPLVKPRFSCTVDTSLSLKGYDVAAELDKMLLSFQRGGRCESGFIVKTNFDAKEHEEFGTARGAPMPDINDYDISVMYRTFYGDAMIFNVSLPTIIRRLPSAREVVVVVEERDGDLFRQLVEQHQEAAPFPIRVITEPTLMDGHIQQKYSKVSCCDGFDQSALDTLNERG